MNILFVHPLIGNAYELYKAFERNESVNIIPLLDKEQITTNSLYKKIRYKLRIPVDTYEINQKLLNYDLSDINVVFVVKCNELYPSTLKKIKEKNLTLKLVNWSLDDMYAWHNRSIFYTLAIKYYDLIVTTKSYNVQELSLLGAKNVKYLSQAYSNNIHTPQLCSDNYKHEVVFIGYPEKERIKSVLFLADNNIRIDIYGYPEAWRKQEYDIRHNNIIIHKEFLEGKDYSKALSCAKISLCFLRKANRDQHTSRSIEIPACKGFMIAERTQEHLDLFEEDKEVVYFDNNEELLKKVQYYLKYENIRKQISENGYKRCLSSGYSYDDMVSKILKVLDSEV